MMKLEIYFTNDEIAQFLKTNGYVLKSQTTEVPVSIHGSAVDWVPDTRIFATKDGKSQECKAAFTQLIKKRLLEN